MCSGYAKKTNVTKRETERDILLHLLELTLSATGENEQRSNHDNCTGRVGNVPGKCRTSSIRPTGTER